MFQRTFLLLLLLTLSAGCAHKNAPKQKDIELQGSKFDEMSRSKVFALQEGPYLGAKMISLETDESALGMRVVLRKRDSLAALGTAISDLTQVNVHISDGEPEAGEKKIPTQTQGMPPALELPDILTLRSGTGPAKMLSINYEGPLRGLLDQITTQSGYGWDYDAKNNTIVFAKIMVRTFTLLAAPGELTYDSQITNKSKETNSNSIGSASRGVSQTVNSSDTSVQTSQTNKTQVKIDVWAATERDIKNMLSKQGSVSSNQAAGTITVKDRPENIRRIHAFVKETNIRISRQVALKVQVWALEISDAQEAGLDLQVLFQNSDAAVVAGSLAALGGLNTASATIVSGKLKGSTAVLKALNQWGNATQITSGGGLVMSNYSMPVMATIRDSFLASVSSSVTDYGQTTEITPGEVTTGFSMTVVPHILDRRRVVLQYNINLSSLDDMKEFKNAGITVQFPKVSTRAFSQRTIMQMGQTLVLAGFQQETQTRDNSLGLLNIGRKTGYGKTLLVITIELESAGNGMDA